MGTNLLRAKALANTAPQTNTFGTLVLTGYEPRASLTFQVNGPDIAYTKNCLTKSIQTASSNITDLGTYNSHTSLGLSLLPHRRRIIDHIQSYYLSASNSWKKQYFCCWNHLQTASEYSISTSDWRVKNYTWVSVAQSILSNTRRRHHSHTE